MWLEQRGHPLHTRGLSITATQRGDAKLDVQGELVDLRKRGFVPVGAKLQPAGIVHQMQLAAVVEPETLRLASLAGAQPAVAFEPSRAVAGESCRDPLRRLGALAGEALGAGFAKKLAGAFGGALGCTHLVILAQLLSSTTLRALRLERERAARGPARPAGSRIFRRDLVADGTRLPGGMLQIELQLTDLHFAPAADVAAPMQHFAGELELRLLAGIEWKSFRLASLTAAQRERTPADLPSAQWRDRSADVARWIGAPLGAGIGGKLIRAYGETPADGPLLDALLNLTPAMHQCFAVLDESWPITAQREPTLVGMGAPLDSCYMWRAGGALDRLRHTASTVEARDAAAASNAAGGGGV